MSHLHDGLVFFGQAVLIGMVISVVSVLVAWIWRKIAGD